MCSTIEDQLSLIASGKASYDKIVGQIINAVRKKYLYFVKNINGMDSVFTCAFISFSATGKAFSRYIIKSISILPVFLTVFLIKSPKTNTVLSTSTNIHKLK